MASFPSRSIARKSYEFRTLGLGYANLGTLLMRQGIPYDRRGGRHLRRPHRDHDRRGYATSAEMAKSSARSPATPHNREAMLRVIRNHRRAAYNAPPQRVRGSDHHARRHRPRPLPDDLAPGRGARGVGPRRSRSARSTATATPRPPCIAPTGTIGLVMDCDTTGIEPDFALVKFKKLAGGGYFKIINQSLAPGPRDLGYRARRSTRSSRYCVGPDDARGAPARQPRIAPRPRLRRRGAGQDRGRASAALRPHFAFNRWTLGEGYLAGRLGLNDARLAEWNGHLLRALGFTAARSRRPTTTSAAP